MLRIVGGQYHGIKLAAPKGDNTRPTTEMVRESIFNMLQNYEFNGPCLDLYAGSGALGIEAFSRFSTPGYLVDRSNDAIRAINNNVDKLHAESQFKIIKSTAHKALILFQEQGIKFSLVFLDPPYLYQNQNSDMDQIIDLGLVEKGTIFVCQGDQELESSSNSSLDLLKFKKYGKTYIYIYRVEE
ncbi:16S rRNA (guanine(966)-N(2))-methyltransferase RsmD [Xylocopilactobacillus apis]|uniref:Methylase n=1 Tax=Xylocopilactobacillus apis TaxID=2932183 RepID=A0AAU9CXP6_9LACO|nr:16S rRNA (guanine(966)-N(2))-methyltransferase RsmD [Xylocopilactobacillus apis]BDR57201.1 methylase [Xylocopilactobacillus apis]